MGVGMGGGSWNLMFFFLDFKRKCFFLSFGLGKMKFNILTLLWTKTFWPHSEKSIITPPPGKIPFRRPCLHIFDMFNKIANHWEKTWHRAVLFIEISFLSCILPILIIIFVLHIDSFFVLRG